MSATKDNIVLTLFSLKKYLEEYLNDNDWDRKYSIFVSGEQELRNKTPVLQVSNFEFRV